jgi:hypothetical protein
MLNAYQAFSGVSLTATFSTSSGGSQPSPSPTPGNVAEVEPNDTAQSAQLISGPGAVTGTVGSASDQDVFRLDASGVLTLGLEVPAGHDYDLELYDLSGNLVTRSVNGAGQSESIQVSAGSGTGYYVLVYGYNSDFSASATYTLTASW